MYFEATTNSTVLEQNLEMSRFRLASIASDDQKDAGFPSYKALMACLSS